MDTDNSLKAGTDVYLVNDFQHGTLSQPETSMDKGIKKHSAAGVGRKQRNTVVSSNGRKQPQI